MTETVIGKGIVIDGEITGTAPVVIEGVVKGKITLDSVVIVANDGVVEADVIGDEVEVSGHVTGTITARNRAEIKSDGRMFGNIKSARILIADGAAFKGHIDMDVD